MATVVNIRDNMLQSATVLRSLRSSKSIYSTTQPWTNLFLNADNPAVAGINKFYPPITNPFGDPVIWFKADASTGTHIINRFNINSLSASPFVSGYTVEQTVYVKNDSSGINHRLACTLTAVGTPNRTLRYIFKPNSGLFEAASTTDAGWSNYSATAAALPNGWWKVTVIGTFTGAGYQINPNWEILDSNNNSSYTGNNTSGLYLYGFSTFYGATIPDEVLGDIWYDTTANTAKTWNGYTFITIGGTSTRYYITSTAPVIKKSAASAVAVGAYSSITLKGNKAVGPTITDYGYLTITADGNTEATAAVAGPITTSIASNAGKSTYTVKLYDSATVSAAILLDTQTIPVVFDGSNALLLTLNNNNCTVPSSNTGVVSDYTGTGTNLSVYEGAGLLIYDGIGTAAGTYTVTSTATNITRGAISGSGTASTAASIGAASGMASGIDTANITFTATGKTSNATAFTLTATQTFSKSKAGVIGSDSTVYYLVESAPVVTKDAPDAATSGTYSAITATGTRSVGSVVTSNYGFVTLTPNTGTEAATATTGSVTASAVTTTGITSYTAKLYAEATKITLLDTSVIPVVFKGNTGIDALTLSMPNSAHTVPTDSAGANGIYTGSGTEIYIYEGTTALQYDAVGTANSSWKIASAVATNITASSSFTDSGTYVTVGQHSAMTADTASILYTLTGKRANGAAFTLTATQTFSKSKQGILGNTGDKTVIVYLYQWSSIDPGAPSGSSSYTWATATHASWSGTGWATTVAANPGTAGIKLWVAAVNITDIGTATTTTVTTTQWTAATRYAVTQNGAAGTDGTKAGTAIVYQWGTTYTPPTGTSVYTWSTGTLDVAPSGWTLTPGTSPSVGYTLWGAAVNLVVGATTTTSTVTWTSASVTARGYAGTNGNQGASIRTAYYRIANNPTAIAGTVTKTGDTRPDATDTTWGAAFQVAWAASDPTPASTNSLYQTDGIYNPVTNQTVWSAPYISALKVGRLDAITVNTGDLTVTGDITMAAGGDIRGGQSAYGTGAGYYIGNVSGTYKFSIGDSTGNQLTWDGATLSMPAASITGTLTASQIAAGAITASKIQVRNGDSVYPDPGWYDRTWWTGGSTVSANIFASESGSWPVRRVLQFSGNIGSFDFSTASFPIELGASYRYKIWIYRSSAQSGSWGVHAHFPDQVWYEMGIPRSGLTPSGVSAVNITTTNTWLTYEGIYTNQATLTSAGNPNTVQQFRFSGNQTAGNMYIAIEMTRAAAGNLIVDGSINATKIEANSITADRIDSKGLDIKDAAGNVIFSSGTGSVTNSSNNITRIQYPGGGTLVGPATQSGALWIILPVGWLNTMLRFEVEIYEYTSAGAVQTYEVGGYTPTSTSIWTNVSATYRGDPAKTRRVAFGLDTPTGRPMVAIGTFAGTWAHPKITIKNLLVSYQNFSVDQWNDGWSTTFQTARAYSEQKQNENPVPGGAFSGLDLITSTNVSTYIDSAAIGAAYIGDLDASKITSGTIAAGRLSVGNISSAINGGATGDRIEITSNKIVVWSGGVARVKIGNLA